MSEKYPNHTMPADEVGKRFAMFRAAAGLSVGQATKLAETSREEIEKTEGGQYEDVAPGLILKLATMYHVPVGAFFNAGWDETDPSIICARFQAGEISEGAAAYMLRCDRLDVRLRAEQQSMNNIARFFEFLATCLQALADELEIDLADMHDIEIAGGIDGRQWWVHLNDEQFAEMRMEHGKPVVCFNAFYSDYDYLLKPYGSGLTPRGMFIAAMRHPSMKLLRNAMRALKWNRDNADWRDITDITVADEIGPYGNWWCWLGNYLLMTWDAHKPALSPDDFSIYEAQQLF